MALKSFTWSQTPPAGKTAGDFFLFIITFGSLVVMLALHDRETHSLEGYLINELISFAGRQQINTE
jgi:hypothetical protein